MEVILLEIRTKELVRAELVRAELDDMKTLQDGWRFNWPKHFHLQNSSAYKLVSKKTGDIEGLMIYQVLQGGEPYLAYIECGHYNTGAEKQFDWIAGCLIAKACQLSFMDGVGHYKGYLSFRCMDERVIRLYHENYGAIRVGKNSMYIEPATAEVLINRYLLRK